MFYTYTTDEGELVRAERFDISESLSLIQSLPEGESIVDVDAEITYETDEFREDYTINGWAYRSVQIEKIVREGEKFHLTCKWKEEIFVVTVVIEGRKVIVEDLGSIPLLR